jgi:hypothetical protein
MSLVAQALVALTHYVLDGRTWADDRIQEQPVDPIGDLLEQASGAQKPVLAVYVESSKVDVDGRETQGKKGELDLKVFVYISPGTTELPEGTVFTLDGRKAGLTLNVVGRQVDASLHFGNPEWIAVWNRFVVNVEERMVRYMLVEIENGARVPTMEITYRCCTIPDPDFGKPIYGAWLAFDSALRAAGGDKILLADLIKGMIENPIGLPDYQDLQANFGLTDAALAATGLGPVPGAVDEDEETVELEEITNDGDTIIVPEDEP